ncbi:MAG: hypothetical protein KKA28_01450, partial [Planctomycetes bacterium]|nr:hypothetical protein [Planctomycetota bacterium]MCG2683168.1 hypothetical protein [Planctomycetales bacterium]
MITIQSNTSRILHNPSHRCEGFELECLQIRSVDQRFGESYTNPSRGRVKDLGGRKSISALSEKMPILPKLNRAIRLPELFASGNRWTLPADNAFDAKSIVRRG